MVHPPSLPPTFLPLSSSIFLHLGRISIFYFTVQVLVVLGVWGISSSFDFPLMALPASSTTPKIPLLLAEKGSYLAGSCPGSETPQLLISKAFGPCPVAASQATRLVSCSDSMTPGSPWMQMFAVTWMQQSAPRTVYLAKVRGPSVPVAVGALGPSH